MNGQFQQQQMNPGMAQMGNGMQPQMMQNNNMIQGPGQFANV